MKNRSVLFIIIIISIVFLFSCQQDPGTVLAQDTELAAKALATAADADISPVAKDVKIIKDTGIIRYMRLEGGFYGIIGRTGNYDPVNLPKEFMQNGLRVQFTAEVCNDMSSIHMWGTLIKLISIQTTASKPKLIMDTGVMHQYLIQGAPWVIAGTTGSYQPINLPEEFEVENLNVCFVGKIRTDIVIIPALWPIIELSSITKIADAPLPVNLNEEFKLQVGKSAIVLKHDILFTFKSVLQDSRCPSDVICVWQGEAVVAVNVKIGNVDYGDFKLSTYNPNVIYVGGYSIQFNNLYPYPATNIKIDPNGYVGYFVIADAPLPVNLYEEFKLQVGKSAIVLRHDLRFTFKSVLQDSRCPSDVVCIWQGEAVIAVNVKIGNVDYGDFKISTYNPRVIYVGSYYIQFNDLYPYPATNIKIDPNEYVGYFIIGSILDSNPAVK